MDISIRLLQPGEITEAGHIFRTAFGTQFGLPDPTRFNGDARLIETRFASDHITAFGAEVDGKLAGSSFATRWGSLGLIGPITVQPELWGNGIAVALMKHALEHLEQCGIKNTGLFTHPESPKHTGLYYKFGFWPRFLTAIMTKPVNHLDDRGHSLCYSALPDDEKDRYRELCLNITTDIYNGLDLSGEIHSVDTQGLGETVLLQVNNTLSGFAVCHLGPHTEADNGVCYVKFGAVLPGDNAEQLFEYLLAACEALAAARGMNRIVAGVNIARCEAYRLMLSRSYRTFIQGVAMHKPNVAGYSRAGIYVIDDWR